MVGPHVVLLLSLSSCSLLIPSRSLCNAGFYASSSANAVLGFTCKQCPEGANCTFPGTVAASIKPLPGLNLPAAHP